ncbi:MULTISPECIES: enoyl-CoA hydratase/isomerase family protein [Marinobacter]|uniref:enoyl-CoA hydratase/isomerase family protein n=2 Tax=Marinobacteraceae TaxID=2887365 RepID=UPI0029438A97|nr:enoyl-CoA hydratase/isomerase family protein [Marinobacter salarius]WOI19666.1 enoyl-CoA hydratase/isomerase family protein [Marinobacter salarius]
MIKLERNDRVATVTLDRAERRNALNTVMVEELDRTLAELDRDETIGAVVLTGAAPSFCAGSDLKELGKMNLVEMAEHEAGTAGVARRIGLRGTPVIAAVEGAAFGGGFILASCCDLVVTGADARWNLAEVPNGWLPPWGLQALVSRVGAVTARRLTWGHEVLSGEDAQRLGVADYVAASDGALAHAQELAARIAALPVPAVASTKQFFSQLINGEAEVTDAMANRVFINNCQHDAAKATLSKFGVKL